MRSHAKLSPSGASRWIKCTAAPSLEAEYPETSSSYAEEGTFAHSLAELCTRSALGEIKKTEYQKELKALQTSEFYNQEMLEHCEEYSTYIVNKLAELKEACPDAFAELEVKLDLTEYVPEGFGTADCIIIAEPKIQVIDFKYGKGVKVEAEGNIQMELYALGALLKYGSLYDVETVGMTIVQPRLGGISEAEIDVGALRAWATTTIKPQAKTAFEGPGAFFPSEETCKFCKAAKDCKARADHFVSLFDDNPITGTLTAKEAGALLEMADGMETWLKDLKEKVTESLFQGTPIPGWKLVEGRSNRVIGCEEDELAEILRTKGKLKKADVYTMKVITLTQIEKLLGKKKTEEILGDKITKPAGAPTLARADDKRPEIFPAEQIVNAFDE